MQSIKAKEIRKDRILIVDDSEFDREKIIRALRSSEIQKYEFMHLESGAALEATLESWNPDLVILDFDLPAFSGLELLRRLVATYGFLPAAFIMATGNGSEPVAVDAMKLGAIDYFVKDQFSTRLIRDLVSRAIVTSRLQTDLRVRQDLTRELAEAMPQIVWILSAEEKFEFVNRQWFLYTGMTLEETNLQSVTACIHEEDRNSAITYFQAAILGGDPYSTEYRYIRRKDAEPRWHLVKLNPIRNVISGEITRWYGTSTDIHDSKLLEFALHDAVRVRDDFLSIASHELKTPLTVLRLKSQLFARQLSQTPMQAPSYERVQSQNNHTGREVEKLIRLVDDMLDITRIQAGKLNFKFEPTNLSELISDLALKLVPLFDHAEITFKYVCAENLNGNFDRLRMEQVVTNLLTNALRYGGKKPVTLNLASSGALALITVSDQGIGIDENSISKLFLRFSRLANTNEAHGLGMGLFITRQILDAHNGTIRVESKGLGLGSTFEVKIPLFAQAG